MLSSPRLVAVCSRRIPASRKGQSRRSGPGRRLAHYFLVRFAKIITLGRAPLLSLKPRPNLKISGI